MTRGEDSFSDLMKKVIVVERSSKFHSHICWVMTDIRIDASLEMTNLMFIL